MIEYRTVYTSTLQGLKEAERLHMNGWKQGRVGLFSVQYFRQKSTPQKRRSIKSFQSESD
jgi:hypothetical protein